MAEGEREMVHGKLSIDHPAHEQSKLPSRRLGSL
jgi:hypothetical protein